jgi:hypothetical protein
MTVSGDRRPPSTSAPPLRRPAPRWTRLVPRTLGAAVAEAVVVGALAALAWALLKGILEFPGVLAVAVLAGWLMGALLWQVRASPVLAVALAGAAWLGGLVLTWLVALAILPGSSRSLLERVSATPFLEWQAPQFGPIEVLGLVLYLAAAFYGARPRAA